MFQRHLSYLFVCVHRAKIKIKCHRRETKINTAERRPISGCYNSYEKKALRTYAGTIEYLWKDRNVYRIFCWKYHIIPPPPMVQQPPVGQGLLMTEVSISHTHTPHSVRLLCGSDQPAPETSLCLTTHNRHACPQRDSNPQSQQASGRQPTP